MDVAGVDSVMAIFGYKRVVDPAPYLLKEEVIVHKLYNPDYGDDRVCQCGHPYYRHFDSYEDMYACGCKYCGCHEFVEESTDKEKEMNQTGIKPVADRNNILDTFEKLIVENDSTTTLEVKEALREDGFWVKQSDVSETIAEYVDNDILYAFTVNQGHKVYRKMSASLPAFLSKPKPAQKTNTWNVTDGASLATYASVTRNQARYMFSQTYSVPYIKVRATIA